MKNIAVTGSSGFIGTKLVARLFNDGFNVIELDHANGIDVTIWEQIKDIKNIDVLIHLASKSYVPDSYLYPKDFYYINTIATLNALELCRINKCKIIFASSYVYGIPQYFPIDEKHPVSGLNPYAQTKIIGEKICEGYVRDFNLNTIIFRPSNVFGIGQNSKFLIPSIIQQINTPEIKLRDPFPKRDYIYIDDIIDAYIMAVKSTDKGLNIFNIGSGISFSVSEIVDKIVSISNKKLKISYSQSDRINEVQDTVYSIEKAKRILNWEPKVSLDKGLENIINNFLSSK